MPDPGTLPARATDLLRRKGLEGSLLRSEEEMRSYLDAVAREFSGVLPGDAWHLYRMKGLTPTEAAAAHREAAHG
jgi:hypothetical protein